MTARLLALLLGGLVVSVSLAGCEGSDSWAVVVAEDELCWRGYTSYFDGTEMRSKTIKGCGSKRYSWGVGSESVYVEKKSGDSPFCIELREAGKTVRAACTTSPTDAGVGLRA